MESEKKIEIKEMPTKEVLEQFLTQMVMGQEVVVYFDSDKGMFTTEGQLVEQANAEQPRCGWA